MKDSQLDKTVLVLASESPRRAELLAQIQLPFKRHAAYIDETQHPGESCIDYARRLAKEKALTVWQQCKAAYPDKQLLVLGADTCGEYDGHLLGKPEDYEDALRILRLLAGKKHWIHSAFALYDGSALHLECVTSKVTLAALTERQIQRYWQTGEPCDKAGAYAIQGLGAQFVAHLEGSYSAVMGLPLYELTGALSRFGCRTLRYD